MSNPTSLAIHELPVEPDRYGRQGSWSFPHETTDGQAYPGYPAGIDATHVVEVGTCSTKFGYGYIDSTGTCRRTHGGPVEAGPHAYLFGLATVLLGPGYQRPTPPTVIHAEVGDEVRFPDGQRFTIKAIAWDRHNFELVPVATSAS